MVQRLLNRSVFEVDLSGFREYQQVNEWRRPCPQRAQSAPAPSLALARSVLLLTVLLPAVVPTVAVPSMLLIVYTLDGPSSLGWGDRGETGRGV